MRKIYYIISIFLATPLLAGFTWKAVNKVKQANKLFSEKKYSDALARYNDAQIDTPNSGEIYFNMGDVFYKLKKYDEAIDSYYKAIERGDVNIEAKAYYNIGNALFRQGRLKEALETYKQALERNPDDVDTKFNIEFTERKIKEMLSRSRETAEKAIAERQRQREKGRQARADEEIEGKEVEQKIKPDEGKGAEKEGKGKQMEFKPGKERQGSGAKEGEREKGEGNGKKRELSKEEAERVLTAFEEEERRPSNLDQMQRSRRGYEYGVEKDW